jgi:2'-5' RNA ligase
VRDAIEAVRDPLRDLAPACGRWVHPSLWHMTLKFLGDVEDELVPAVADLASEVAQRHDAFTLGLGPLGMFPNAERPRALWVGATEGAAAFEALAAALDEGLDGLGFQADEQPALAHLTIARFRDPFEAGELPAHLGGDEIARFDVREIVLMKSVLRPRGPDYSVVERLPLVLPPGLEVTADEEVAVEAETPDAAPTEAEGE